MSDSAQNRIVSPFNIFVVIRGREVPSALEAYRITVELRYAHRRRCEAHNEAGLRLVAPEAAQEEGGLLLEDSLYMVNAIKVGFLRQRGLLSREGLRPAGNGPLWPTGFGWHCLTMSLRKSLSQMPTPT